jgi:hypothetical protein
MMCYVQPPGLVRARSCLHTLAMVYIALFAKDVLGICSRATGGSSSLDGVLSFIGYLEEKVYATGHLRGFHVPPPWDPSHVRRPLFHSERIRANTRHREP